MWKYDLPPDVEDRIEEISEQSRTGTREDTAERVSRLIQYIHERHPEFEYNDQLLDYLNGVITSLYENE